MSYGICAFCRPEVAPGMRLAGIPTTDRAEEVGDLVARQRAGVLLVQDDLQQAIPEELRSRAIPMVVLFPAPSWEGARPGKVYIVELLRRAIGYRVRLK